MTECSSKIIDIIKSNIVEDEALVKSKIQIFPDIPDVMIKNAFRAFKLPIIYDDILAIFDLSPFLNCKSGLIFIENGIFVSRTLETTYYVNYTDIENCEIEKNKLIIVLTNGDLINVSCLVEQAEYLQKVLRSLASKSRIWDLNNNERKTGTIKNLKDLISKSELIKCHLCIHGAATACGGIGATPHIPLSDSLLITPIQISMLINLGQIFNETITKSSAQAILLGLSSSFVGRNIASLTVGWIPGIGNVVNLTTAASMTELIGWSFVREMSQNKEYYIRKKIYDGVKYFHNLIDRLSDETFSRLAQDISFISGEGISNDRDYVSDVFFNVMAHYAFLHNICINDIFIVYTKYLKKILEKMENRIVNNSQAQKYYQKFQTMTFDSEDLDFEKFTDFVELFLGLYNSLIFKDIEEGISKFCFDIKNENPDTFFYLLYINKAKEREKAICHLKENGDVLYHTDRRAKSKSNEKKLYEKKAIHVLTSLSYCYALEREGEQV